MEQIKDQMVVLIAGSGGWGGAMRMRGPLYVHRRRSGIAPAAIPGRRWQTRQTLCHVGNASVTYPIL